MHEKPIVARRAALEEIFQVRWDVLRPDRPIETARFTGDDAPDTMHFGTFVDGRNIACATATRALWQDRPAWQLRGMGVVAPWRKKGVGQQLLAELEAQARQSAELGVIWCNAREEAVAFYEKQGWRRASESFYIEDVGPHFKMTKAL